MQIFSFPSFAYFFFPFLFLFLPFSPSVLCFSFSFLLHTEEVCAYIDKERQVCGLLEIEDARNENRSDEERRNVIQILQEEEEGDGDGDGEEKEEGSEGGGKGGRKKRRKGTEGKGPLSEGRGAGLEYQHTLTGLEQK